MVGIRERIEQEVEGRMGPAVKEMKVLEDVLRGLNKNVVSLNKNVAELIKKMGER